MATKPRRKMTPRGRKAISRAMKRRWALSRAATAAEDAQNNLPVRYNHAREQGVAACFGYISHTIEEYARRLGIPAAELANRMGEILRGEASR